MPRADIVTPRIQVRLFKTVSRESLAGTTPVSTRYRDKDGAIDLTPFLGQGSSVNTSKSVREPAGAFTIAFNDRPHQWVAGAPPLQTALESVYGLIEPMDVIEIRIWNGRGTMPDPLPIKMRGFVSDVRRSRTMGANGTPHRQVVITGHDYGKIWQTFQVLHLPAYLESSPLLTSFAFSELFGADVVNTMRASDFVAMVVDKVLNPHLAGFMPEDGPMPRAIQPDMWVMRGRINKSYQGMEGSLYDITARHADAGVWNELYIEDRADGVYCVYRPTPARHLESGELIQEEAYAPPEVDIYDSDIQSVSSARTDADVANFFWVNNSRFDLVDDHYRKRHALTQDNETVNLSGYDNAAVKYYGVRPMYADTQMGDLAMMNLTSGLPEPQQEGRSYQFEAWLDNRRRMLLEMNKDNPLFERGSARVKGGPMRADGEFLKAGDYARFHEGRHAWSGYITSVVDEFRPFESYATTLTFERGTGFAERARLEGGAESPWLAEQARR